MSYDSFCLFVHFTTNNDTMKIPRGKPRDIFVGEEIYYTGGAHTQYVLYLHVRCYSFNRCKQWGIDPALQ